MKRSVFLSDIHKKMYYIWKPGRKTLRFLYGDQIRSNGNRLIMMHDGSIIYDVSREEKKNLKVSDLLAKFDQVSGGEFANDRMMLSH